MYYRLNNTALAPEEFSLLQLFSVTASIPQPRMQYFAKNSLPPGRKQLYQRPADAGMRCEQFWLLDGVLEPIQECFDRVFVGHE